MELELNDYFPKEAPNTSMEQFTPDERNNHIWQKNVPLYYNYMVNHILEW